MRDTKKELIQLGLSPRRISFWDIIYAVELVQSDMSSLTAITKEIYAKTGLHRSVEWDCAEASIRRGILAIWEQGNRAKLEQIMHYSLLGPPTAGEFLGAFVFYLEDNS